MSEGKLPPSTEDTSGKYAKVGHVGINYILGQLLTFSDMSFPDPVQRKAFKDSVQSTIWNWWHHYELYEETEYLFIDALRELYQISGLKIPKEFDPVIEVPRLVKAIKETK